MSSKIKRTSLAAGLACVGLAVAAQSQAAVIYMNLADINPAIGGIMGFNGVSMQALGGQDDLQISVGAAVFPSAQFNLTFGWNVTSTLIIDNDSSNSVTNGDGITANIGLSSFNISNPSGVLVTGTFSSAVLNSAVGSSTININSGNVNGLDLQPGPVLVGLGYPAFDPAESLAISVVGINPGVQIAVSAPVLGTPFFTGSMAPFGLAQNTPTSGSVDMVADLVPEPASLGLAGVAVLGLASRRRQRIAKKLAVLSLAACGMLAMSGSQAQAAIVNMNLSDINAPIGGIAGFNGTHIVSLGGVDNFIITGHPVFPNAFLDILGPGFAVGNVVVSDANLNGLADPGETISAGVGGGSFRITNPSGDIVLGTFASATLSTSVGSSSVTINAANVNGLDLAPGLVLQNLGVIALDPPESFSINVVGVAPGVSVGGVSPLGPGFLLASLNPFGVGQQPPTSGSVNLVADEIIPEPATLGLLSVGALGLLARRRRHA